MTAENFVKSVTVIVDGNPIPLAAVFHFNPKSGKAEISTRIRLEMDALVHVVAETNDGRYYMNAIPVRASGGCGGDVGGDESVAKQTAGKMKVAVEEPSNAGVPVKARLLIKHPMYTGLQRDLLSQGYRPAFFISKIDAKFNGEAVMQAETFMGISEDPMIQFYFVPEKSGKLVVTIDDNENGQFHHQTDVSVP